MQNLTAETLPAGLFDAAQSAIVVYAQKSTRLEPITDAVYGNLARHFSPQNIIDICMTVGLSNMVNRFHATFQTDVDAETLAEVEAGDVIAGACAIPIPKPPAG